MVKLLTAGVKKKYGEEIAKEFEKQYRKFLTDEHLINMRNEGASKKEVKEYVEDKYPMVIKMVPKETWENMGKK